MAVELKVPQLGESITEAVVGKWHKRPGDLVAADEPVVALETDKVTVDVQAPSAGALLDIAFPEGAKVKIGDVLGTIGPGAATLRPAGAQATGVQVPAGAKPSAPGAQAQESTKPSAPPAPTAPAAPPGPAPSATPVARRVAEDRGIPLESLSGSGAGGRVLKEDVVRAAWPGGHPAVARAPAAPPPPVPAPPPGARPEGARAPEPAPPDGADGAHAGREERVKMTPLRKRVAERLLAAQGQAAILTTFNEVDMSAVMALRKAWGERFSARHNVKLGFMGFFVKAAVEALKEFPSVNARIDGDEVVFQRFYDIGVAVSGSRGLVVPVVRDADLKSFAELEKAIAELGARARADKLSLPELQGGTFTISNGGVFGSMLSTPILNPPQTGILGMHNIVDRPVVRDGQIVVRPVMYLALSYDHRLIDGREAVQFLVRIKECIETPERILLEA